MKVLHVIPSLSAAHGGPTRAMQLIEHALTARGVDIETATTDDDGPGRRLTRPVAEPVHEGPAVRRYFRRQSAFYKVSLPFASWMKARVRDYDIVHVHALFSFLPVFAAHAARSAGVPYVIRPLGTLEGYGLRERRPLLKRLSLALLEAPLLSGASAVHFTSESEAKQALGLGIPLHPAVIPLGVEVAHATPRSFDAGPLRLLWLSRLDRKKNLEGLLQALKDVTLEGRALQLDVAGASAPDYEHELRTRVHDLGLAGSVRWLGHVEGDAKAAAWAGAHVFVLPSHSENFGIAAAEALAHGLPCLLATGVALADEVAAADAGWAVSPQPADLARALRLIIDRRADLESMAANARALAIERYSMDAMGARLNELYTEIKRR